MINLDERDERCCCKSNSVRKAKLSDEWSKILPKRGDDLSTKEVSVFVLILDKL